MTPDAEINELTGTDETRKVFGGISDVNAQGNLMEATLRHEIGHGVDQKIQFTENLAKRSDFGAWKTHFLEGNGQPASSAKMAEYADALLTKAGFSAADAAKKIGPYPDLKTQFISTVLATPSVAQAQSFQGIVDAFWNGDPQLPQKKVLATEAIRLGLLSANVPWQLDDGSIQQITHNGRVYQRDHYKSYVSYAYAARANAVSNYQFSSLGRMVRRGLHRFL